VIENGTLVRIDVKDFGAGIRCYFRAGSLKDLVRQIDFDATLIFSLLIFLVPF